MKDEIYESLTIQALQIIDEKYFMDGLRVNYLLRK